MKDDFETSYNIISTSDTVYNAFAMFDPYSDEYRELIYSSVPTQLDMYNAYDTDINNAYRRLNSI